MIVDADTANQHDLAVAVEKHDLVYLTGGDPIYLADTLRGSQTWASLLAVHARGGLIAGSSAGAMVLGGQLWRFDGWVPGLGLVPSIIMIPHFDRMQLYRLHYLMEHVPEGLLLVGVDEHTVAIGGTDGWEVMGRGKVHVFTPAGETIYGAGDRIPALPPASL